MLIRSRILNGIINYGGTSDKSYKHLKQRETLRIIRNHRNQCKMYSNKYKSLLFTTFMYGIRNFQTLQTFTLIPSDLSHNKPLCSRTTYFVNVKKPSYKQKIFFKYPR